MHCFDVNITRRENRVAPFDNDDNASLWNDIGYALGHDNTGDHVDDEMPMEYTYILWAPSYIDGNWPDDKARINIHRDNYDAGFVASYEFTALNIKELGKVWESVLKALECGGNGPVPWDDSIELNELPAH